MSKRIIVAITGASGAIYGVRALQVLRQISDVETHLVMTSGSRMTMAAETKMPPGEVEALADVVHSNRNLGAAVSSGSFQTDGMIVAPCSIKTLSGIAHAYSENLVVRAADVVLKERRRLVLLVRETPLHSGHIRLMSDVTQSGAIVFPPVPAFYHRPVTIEDLIDQTIARVLDLFGIESDLFTRWPGTFEAPRSPRSQDR